MDVLEEDIRLAEEKTAGNPGILQEIEAELEREESDSLASIKTIFPNPLSQKKKTKSEEGSKKRGGRSLPALSDGQNNVPLKQKASEISYMVSGKFLWLEFASLIALIGNNKGCHIPQCYRRRDQ